MHCVEGYMRFVTLHIPLILGVKVLHIANDGMNTDLAKTGLFVGPDVEY